MESGHSNLNIMASAGSSLAYTTEKETLSSLLENIDKNAISIQSMVEGMDSKLHGIGGLPETNSTQPMQPCARQRLQSLDNRLNRVRAQLEAMHDSVGQF